MLALTKADEIVKKAMGNNWHLVSTPALLDELKFSVFKLDKCLDLIPSGENWENTIGKEMRRRTQRALELAELAAQKKYSKAISILKEAGYTVSPPPDNS